MGVYERPGQSVPAASALPGWADEFLRESAEWSEGRSWMVRAPLLLYLAWALFRHVVDPEYASWFAALSLGLHELGHVVFGFLPFFLVALAGSAVEVIVPFAGMVMFLRQPDFFGISVLGCWLSYNLFGIGRYIADSRDQFGIYVSIGGGEAQHDWEYILSSLGLLQLDKVIGGMVKLLATGVGIASLVYGGWLLVQMAQSRRG